MPDQLDPRLVRRALAQDTALSLVATIEPNFRTRYTRYTGLEYADMLDSLGVCAPMESRIVLQGITEIDT
jgi:hypothetical protein